ncbi:MAG TPA: ZIP family metal transporter [Bacteroidia bacterium]|nr:ZIP family metal transporter [Bacteroidia bacterium]
MREVLYILFLVAPILLTGSLSLAVRISQTSLRLILAFSAAYLFALAIMHLLPEAYSAGNAKLSGLFIVLGFCVQLFIDTFSTGIEHGHVHLHSHDCKTHLPSGIIIGLFLHSLLEGLPLYDISLNRYSSVNPQLVFGLALHNIPITLAFVALLVEHHTGTLKKWLLLLGFSLMSPLGYLISYLLQNFGFRNYQMFGGLAFALVIGIFLHISTAILFESSEQHKYNRSKILIMTVGILLAYLIS